MDIKEKLKTAKQWLFAVVRSVFFIELDKERRKDQSRPLSERIKEEYERRHGAGSMWFSGRTERFEGESLTAFTARRYAEAIAGIHAALDARKEMQAYLKRNRFKVFRAGMALGIALGTLFATDAIGAGWGAFLTAVWILAMAAWVVFGGDDSRLIAAMTKNPLSKEGEQEAARHVGETLVRVPAADAPEDLRDLYRLPFVDTEGRPLSERVIETDLTEDYFAIEANEQHRKGGYTFMMWLMGGQAVGALAVAALGLLIAWPETTDQLMASAASVFGVVGLVTGLIAVGTLVALLNWGLPNNGIRRRAGNLSAIADKSVDQLALQAGVAGALVQDEKALVDQITNAKNDPTPFFKLGDSSGFLRQRFDVFAPSVAGMPFGLSFNDLSTHLIVLGGTGSGKTSGTIRPLVKQWLGYGQGGLLVLDGKGQLPAEISDESYSLISPKTTTINPIEGLTPDDVAETLADLAGSEDASDPYWVNAAAKLIRSAAHAAKVLADAGHGKYNLAGVYTLIVSEDEQERARNAITENKLKSGLSGAARRGLDYALLEFPKMPEKQRGSIEGIASLWLSQITDNEKLAHWADAESGFEVEAVCRGEQIGVVLPESDYGKAGVLASGLLKKRVYEAIKRRGDGWQEVEGQTPVLVVIDEVQALLTDDETAMLPIARSLGLYAAFSTQNVDGILSKLGDHAGYQLLGNLRSMVAYQTQTSKTTEYISERMGSTYRPQISHAARYEDLGSRLQKVAHGAVGNTGDYKTGLKATLYTAGQNMALQSHAVLNFVLNPENRVKDNIEHYSAEGTIFDYAVIEQNRNIESANLVDGHGSMEQTLSLSRVVDVDEVNEVLSQPNTALAQVIRGRVVRRDLISATPIYTMVDADAGDAGANEQIEDNVIEGELA